MRALKRWGQSVYTSRKVVLRKRVSIRKIKMPKDIKVSGEPPNVCFNAETTKSDQTIIN